ncbi:hypothetical protein GGF46_003026 [Coemansia sp. RSA 552]|nr:hypothetical protein GGF46_003026 [Coemansia sp. RSA 552]
MDARNGGFQQQQQQQQQQQPHMGSYRLLDVQHQNIDALLQCLERLEGAGSKFFDSLAMVGQGPPSLLAAQLVSLSQLCKQMSKGAESALLLNVPVAAADPVFSEASTALSRVGTGTQAEFGDSAALGAWAQETATQSSTLFAERRRIAANAQAGLSVPPPKQLESAGK